jgi:hypothetical protein
VQESLLGEGKVHTACGAGEFTRRGQGPYSLCNQSGTAVGLGKKEE